MSEWDVNVNSGWHKPFGEEPAKPVESLTVGGVVVRCGDRVRLNPRAGADILDLALAGKVAIVEAIECDLDDRLHVAVVLEDDPGRDLGMMRQPGHRFFFSPQEITPITSGSEVGHEH